MSLREFFRGATLEVEDLYLLEAFQISYFPGWVPEREFAAVLWAYPSIKRFLLKKNPLIGELVERVMAQYGPAADEQELAAFEDELVWTIADLLIYSKCPEFYDAMEFHGWDFGEVTGITPLEDKVVIDGGAGTGRVALEAAQTARQVFAVEPVARLRQFVREKAATVGLDNVYVMDGFLHAIPLPDEFADVLITAHALGWYLEDELQEFGRVVKSGGFIIHCPGTAEIPSEEERHKRLISPDWGYAHARYEAPDGWKRKYWKQVGQDVGRKADDKDLPQRHGEHRGFGFFPYSLCLRGILGNDGGATSSGSLPARWMTKMTCSSPLRRPRASGSGGPVCGNRAFRACNSSVG